MSMESKSLLPKRPRLSVDELHQLRWLLGSGLTLVSAWSMLYLEIDAWVLMGVITLATTLGLVWPRLPSHVPMFVHTFAFPLIVAFFLGDLWLKGDALPAIVRLDMMLLFYRGISYRQRRDDLQVIVLGLFLIVVAGVLTVSMVFAVQLLAFAACALALLLVLTLLQGIEEGTVTTPRGEVPPWVDVNWRRLLARLRLVTDWRVVLLGGLLFAGVVAVSALLFVMIPRFQLENSLFLERFIVRKARTGFSDSIKFGDVTEIQQDTAVALNVDVSDRTQVPASPYWRMVILDQYENGTFKLSPVHNSGFGDPKTDARLDGTLNGAKPVYWTFYFEPGLSKFLPLIGAFSELRFTERQNYQFNPRLGLVKLQEEPATMMAYRVEGFEDSPLFSDPGFLTQWKKERKSAALLQLDLEKLSAVDRSTLTRIAEEISAATPSASRLGDPAENFIGQAATWLRRNHRYSLSPRVPGGPGDPLVLWLSSNEAGHCELFAGSLVLLARAAGFPARVVTGFRGGSWNGYSNSLTLRNSDAHAWAEIFDEEKGGWLRADALGAPTAAASSTTAVGAASPLRRIDRGWTARIESLRVFWYRRIVSFDHQTQVETLQAIKESTEKSGRHLRESFAQAVAGIKQWLTAPWDLGRLLRGLPFLAVLAGMGWVWRELGRGAWRKWRHRKQGRVPDPVRYDASRWLARLEEIEADEPENARVRAELQRLRFGARVSWPEPRQVFRRAKRAVRDGRRRRTTARPPS